MQAKFLQYKKVSKAQASQGRESSLPWPRKNFQEVAIKKQYLQSIQFSWNFQWFMDNPAFATRNGYIYRKVGLSESK